MRDRIQAVLHIELNPSKWDLIAESESELDEEIEVSFPKGATYVSHKCPVIAQKLKAQEERPEGQNPRTLPPFLKHLYTSAQPYTSAELAELATKFCQKRLESIMGWLLHLWDTGANGIIPSGDEKTQMASVTTRPSLYQCIHGAIQYAENASLLIGLWRAATGFGQMKAIC